MKRLKPTIKITVSLEDKIRKEMLETITRSYEDTHPLSYLMIELQRLNDKFGYTR